MLSRPLSSMPPLERARGLVLVGRVRLVDDLAHQLFEDVF